LLQRLATLAFGRLQNALVFAFASLAKRKRLAYQFDRSNVNNLDESSQVTDLCAAIEMQIVPTTAS
jgi:hypothetical protein